MDVYTLLKQDHKKLKALFEALEKPSMQGVKARQALFTELNSELRLHVEAEETVFYLRILRPKATHHMTLEAMEEHRVVKTLLSELDSDPKDTEQWDAKLAVLKEVVEHHVVTEEGELFEQAQEVLSRDEAEMMAREIEAYKEEASFIFN